MTSELTMTAMPATVLKSGYSPGSMIQLSTAPRTGLIKRHILMSLTFVPSVRRAMNQKTEGEDRDEDQHAETRIEPDGLGPEGVETLRRDAHAVNQQAAEKHLHGIQENRIDLALVLRNRNRGIALEQDAGQQQDDTPDAAPVERRTVAARADDQQQSREAHRKTHDLVTVQAVVAGHEVRQQHVSAA